MARPKLELDEDNIEKLAAIGCTNEEIASFLGVSADTIERRFAGAIKKGKLSGFVSVKRRLYEKATSGDLGAIIWFGKQFMGWRDKQALEHTGSDGKPLPAAQIIVTIPSNGRESKD